MGTNKAANLTFWNLSFRRQRISIEDFAARSYAVGAANSNKGFHPIQLPDFSKENKKSAQIHLLALWHLTLLSPQRSGTSEFKIEAFQPIKVAETY